MRHGNGLEKNCFKTFYNHLAFQEQTQTECIIAIKWVHEDYPKGKITFLAPSGAQGVTMCVRSSVRPVQVCLELSIFIILAQVSLGSLLGLS